MRNPKQISLLFGISVYSFATQRSDLISSTVLRAFHRIYTITYCQSIFLWCRNTLHISVSEATTMPGMVTLFFFFYLWDWKVRFKNQ